MVARPSVPSRSSIPDTGTIPRVPVPKTVTDPVWSLRPWPVLVRVAGHLLEIPAMSATDWLTVLMEPNLGLDEVFPGMLPDDQADLVHNALFDSIIDLEQLSDIALDIISEVCGRPWWIALRLIITVRESWHVIGAEMLLKGVDSERLSISGWLDVALLVLLRNIDPKEVAMFTAKLEQPPEDVDPESVPGMEMAASDFMAMA